LTFAPKTDPRLKTKIENTPTKKDKIFTTFSNKEQELKKRV